MWPAIKKACPEGRVIALADEIGLNQRPHRVRTWGPRGQTPVLRCSFNWKPLAVVPAGLTAGNFYLCLYSGAIKSPQVVEFLNALARAIRRLSCWPGTGSRCTAAA